MTWDLKPLRHDMERLYGGNQVQLIQPCLDSIRDRRGFACYHFSEANRLMHERIGEKSNAEVVGAMFGAFDNQEDNFEWARFQAAAHITACVQSMHSMIDILGQIIYLGLGMNLDKATAFKNERGINIATVAKRLHAGEITNQVNSLVNNQEATYLSALNNHSKHRSIVPVSFSVDLTGEDELPHGLKFKAFQYDGVPYHARWVRPTLEAEYQRQETVLLGIGNALNVELAGRV